jgi:small subunit ribosomal protein S17
MYFGEFEYYYAHDPEKICKTGDMVMIQQFPQKLTRLIKHKVLDFVYPCGDITNLITGKKVVVSKYRDEIEGANKMYGQAEGRFQYDTAPKKGWQEDKKNFTHGETYKKYHVFENDDQPYAV